MVLDAVKALQSESGVPAAIIEGAQELDTVTEVDGPVRPPPPTKKRSGWRNLFKRRSKFEIGADITMAASDRQAVVADVSSGKLSATDAFSRFTTHEEGALANAQAGSQDQRDRRMFRRRSVHLKQTSRERLNILRRVREKAISVEEASQQLQQIEDKSRDEALKGNLSSSEDEAGPSPAPRPAAKPRKQAKPPPPKPSKDTPADKPEDKGSSVVFAFDAIVTDATPLTQPKRAQQQQKRPPTRARLRQKRAQAQAMGSDATWSRLAGDASTDTSAAASASSSSSASKPGWLVT